MDLERQKQALGLYAALMEEVKIRAASIAHAKLGRTGHVSHLDREFCFLQLRMVAELIALACLVAHGDIQGTQANAIRGSWSAEQILKGLEKLHLDFYPHPVKRTEVGPDSFHLEPITSGFLTRKELPLLVQKCGETLHRGSMKRLLSSNIPKKADFTEVDQWMSKVDRLLTFHRIALFDGNSFLCLMSNPEQRGAVQTALGVANHPGRTA